VQKRGYAEGEIELVCKDGSTVLVWRRLRALHDENNHFNGTVAYSRDITERMKAVRQISTLARALEQSPLAVLITDGEGTIEYINFRFTELTGYTYEEAVGQNLRFVKSVDQSPDTFRELWETISEGEEWQGEFYNLSRDGEAYWEYLTIAPMFSPQGTITHFIAVQDDITIRKEIEQEAIHSQQRVSDMMTEHIGDLTTANERLQQEIAERKRIEQELRRNRARLKAQYKGIPVPTYSWQQSGDNLILVDYNDVAENDSEGRIADFLGKNVNEVFKNNPQVLADFAHCLTKQTTVQREAPYQLITTGEIKYYVTTYNFVPPELVVVHIQDITEQRHAEERLREYQEKGQDTSEVKAELAKIKEVLLAEKAEHQAEVEKRREIEIDFNHYRKQVERSPSEQVAELEALKATLEKEITKRQQLEKTLRENEERMQQIAGNIDDRLREQYRSIPVPTYSWQRIAGEFVLIDFNDAAAASMGKIVDFFGKTANENFKDLPEVLADFELCYREKAQVVRESPYKLITSGETRFFVTTYNFVPPILVIDHIQVITEQKQLEAEME
jgi:PAS domain S-box-containing protein